ncbi:hypothetical protein ZWY2020_039595 [Hordeum vulgare]|nr:hypothetical protein ZWY2020_039595 [Hordeum vulgare]
MEFPRQPAHPQPIEAQASALSERSEELLMHVFATLEIPDLARVDSVCTSWRSAYAALCSLGKHKQAQTPCLPYTSVSAGHGAGAAGMRRPNKEILEHDRRWQTELRMVKLRDTLEEQGCSEADIEQGVKQARKEAAGGGAGGGTLCPGEGYLQDCKEGEVYAVESSEAVRKKREPHLLVSRRSRTTKMAAALAWRFSGTNSGADLVGATLATTRSRGSELL